MMRVIKMNSVKLVKNKTFLINFVDDGDDEDDTSHDTYFINAFVFCLFGTNRLKLVNRLKPIVMIIKTYKIKKLS